MPTKSEAGMQSHQRLICARGPSTAARTKKAEVAITRSSNNWVEGMLAVQTPSALSRCRA